MKISKLFHWLYAILMLLPILVFIPNALYYGFNEQAVAQEKTEQVPVYYESNEVNTYDDLIVGNIYSITIPNGTNFSNGFTISISSYYLNKFNITNTNSEYTPSINVPYITRGTFSNLIGIVDSIENSYVLKSGYGCIDFVLIGISNNSYQVVKNYLYKCNTNYVKEYQEITTNMSITDSMSYAWESVWQNDLFSWAYSSFLTQPFIYIGSVFGIEDTNTIYYALSYWLDISIIWLVFDVIMYVPLLVHRWLDKGIIE